MFEMKKKKKEKDNNKSNNEFDDESVLDGLPIESVIKVFASLTSPNFERPWQMCYSEECSGSGFAIKGNRILTNAHVVEHATFIAVRRFGFAERVPAEVICISYDCDIAVLVIANEKEKVEFWKGLTPLVLADHLPYLQDEVLVAGFPMGGDNISITRGIVSRIEPIEYTDNKEFQLLAVQIDAAVNSGNSGGPCFKNNMVVGIAFQGLDEADGISYIIPMPIVNHFMTEFEEKGSFGGFCTLGFCVQYMENRQLRKAYKMPRGSSGIRIRWVDPLSAFYGKVKEGDIMQSIDGVSIGNDGSVRFRKRELIPWEHLITQKFSGSNCKLEILRDGNRLEIEANVNTVKELIPATPAAPAHFFFWAGLVFVPASQPFLDECYGEEMEEAPTWLIGISDARRTHPEQQVIVLASVLSDQINCGYEEEDGRILKKVNGEDVIHLQQLVEIVQGLKEGVITFELIGEVVMVFDVAEVIKRNPRIMKAYKIPTMTNIYDDNV